MGIKDYKYGEVVGAFLRFSEQAGTTRPDLQEVKKWTQKTLGSHKAPVYVFWIGEDGFNDFPKTGSGKYQKHILKDIGDRVVKEKKMGPRAKL